MTGSTRKTENSGGFQASSNPIYPILHLSSLSLYVAEEFAADVLFASLRAGHDAFTGGKNRDAHAAADARDVSRANVTPQARRADPAQAFDDALFALIFESHLNEFWHFALDCKIVNVTFSLQNAGDAFLNF